MRIRLLYHIWHELEDLTTYNHCINVVKKRTSRYKAFNFYRWQQLNARGELDYSDLVGEMLSQLSSKERNLILLRIIDERSYEERRWMARNMPIV